MLTFAHMLTMRNFGVIYDKFHKVEVRTSGDYTQKISVNCTVICSVILASLSV